jgi:hypothetical protein
MNKQSCGFGSFQQHYIVARFPAMLFDSSTQNLFGLIGFVLLNCSYLLGCTFCCSWTVHTGTATFTDQCVALSGEVGVCIALRQKVLSERIESVLHSRFWFSSLGMEHEDHNFLIISYVCCALYEV